MPEAGQALPDHKFEAGAVAAHATLFLRLFDEAEKLGYRLPYRRVTMSENGQTGRRARYILLVALAQLETKVCHRALRARATSVSVVVPRDTAETLEILGPPSRLSL
jgi:hypothetical protein